jgi:NusA-like KH domain protein
MSLLKMKYNLQQIQYVNLFEKKTKTHVKDCFFYQDRLVFIVMPGQASKAVGKLGTNVKYLSNLTKKKIKIVEFSDNPVEFIKSFIAPIEPAEITLENKIITIKPKTVKDKGHLIGRDSKNIKAIKEITKKYYDIENIKIA